MTHDADVRIYVNGRFRSQSLSGVQRFAIEMTNALEQAHGERLCVLVPPDAPPGPRQRTAGRLKGHAWEQCELPLFAGGGLLVNLGNTAPVLARRQVVVIHDAGVFSTPEAYSRPFRAWYKSLQWLLAKRAVPVVTVSEFSRRDILRHLPVAPDQVRVISEGADHFARIQAAPGTLADLGLEAGRYVLLVGTLARHKNLGALGVLARRLAAEEITLAVTGSFGTAAFSNSANPLPQPARYLGRVTDEALKALYASAACLLFPSLYEGFGLPALEAMACGCPVVAAAIPALREVCADAVLYCDPASPEDIAAQVVALLRDPAMRQRLREAGLARAGGFTWARAAAMLSEVFPADFARAA